jgi:Tfp pilus assembly protein PilX
MLLLIAQLQALIHTRIRQRNDRGDVPGWVLITVMTATLVAALLVIAKDQLSAMLTNALNQVK